MEILLAEVLLQQKNQESKLSASKIPTKCKSSTNLGFYFVLWAFLYVIIAQTTQTSHTAIDGLNKFSYLKFYM